MVVWFIVGFGCGMKFVDTYVKYFSFRRYVLKLSKIGNVFWEIKNY